MLEHFLFVEVEISKSSDVFDRRPQCSGGLAGTAGASLGREVHTTTAPLTCGAGREGMLRPGYWDGYTAASVRNRRTNNIPCVSRERRANSAAHTHGSSARLSASSPAASAISSPTRVHARLQVDVLQRGLTRFGRGWGGSRARSPARAASQSGCAGARSTGWERNMTSWSGDPCRRWR
jgi:hypothetical protein